jgi:hypothetical protein
VQPTTRTLCKVGPGDQRWGGVGARETGHGQRMLGVGGDTVHWARETGKAGR